MNGNRSAATLIAAILLLAACDAASVSSSSPTSGSATSLAASSRPTTPADATVDAVELVQIIATSEATALGLGLDYMETGRSALTFVVRSGRNAEFEALEGFVDGQLAGFSGDAGALLSAAMAFDSGEHAQTALDLFLGELSAENGYGFGAGEPVGVGDDGECDRGPNPHLDGLIESICVWRNAAIVLIAGGPMAMADIRAIAEAMDARAGRIAATGAEACRGPVVDWSALAARRTGL